MDKVNLSFEYCYGIKKLDYIFNFDNARAFAIYAPNGVMKSSLAHTFQDAASSPPLASVDRIFTARKTVRNIRDEKNAEIEGERVLVVLPYDPDFGPTEKTSILFLDAKLRAEHDKLHQAINQAKNALLTGIQKRADSKADFEVEISTVFTNNRKFQLAVTRIRDELETQKDALFADVKFDVIFNDKVLKALESKDLKATIENYIKRYNELIAASTYFKKGTFDYFNAGQIAKSLADNGFFDAKHTVNLKALGGNGILEIKTQKELEGVIAKEKQAIIKDAKLVQAFNAIAKQLDKNADLRNFCHYLQNNEALLSRMDNLDQFKEDVIKSYIKANYDLYLDLMAKYDGASKRTAEIEELARQQNGQWEEVIEIFNERFFVPFRLVVRNQIEVTLGHDAIIDMGFTYFDGLESADLERKQIVEFLSTGEKKALYILNVIFEVQRRRKAQQETLMVVDDVADSFDYQNKYAIIQYLKDISEDGLFKLIIMTHNFDFFRTIESRFVGYSGCLMASRVKDGISLVKATGIRNIFANDWNKVFFTDSRKKIASIPFLRNMIEMTTGDADPNYKKLTSMLHVKDDTDSITVGDLDKIHNAVCQGKGASADPKKLISELIKEEANECLKATQVGLNLENKIVLAIGIRLAAEEFMIAAIKDQNFVKGIGSDQTQALVKKFKDLFPDKKKKAGVLDRVALMTPENIHVNAFMYEPIVDMSDEHLKRLYRDVQKLM